MYSNSIDTRTDNKKTLCWTITFFKTHETVRLQYQRLPYLIWHHSRDAIFSCSQNWFLTLSHIPFPLDTNENKKVTTWRVCGFKKELSMQLLLPNIVTNAAILFGKHHKKTSFFGSLLCIFFLVFKRRNLLCMRITFTTHLYTVCCVNDERMVMLMMRKKKQTKTKEINSRTSCRVKRTEIKTFRYNQISYHYRRSFCSFFFPFFFFFHNNVIWPVGQRSRNEMMLNSKE